MSTDLLGTGRGSLGIRGAHFGNQWPILCNQVTGFKHFMTMHSLLLHYENKTKECIWSYVNLLQHKCRENLACFGHLLWPSSGRCFSKDILQRNIFVIYPSGRNMWKIYDVYIIVNSHNFIRTLFYFHRKLSTKSCLYFKNLLHENQNVFIQLERIERKQNYIGSLS